MIQRAFLMLVAVGMLAACSNSSGGTADTGNGNEVVTIKPGDARVTEVTDGKTLDTTGHPDIDIPPGYLEFCLGDGDCAEWGLTCFAEGQADQNAFCSLGCEANSDCPEMMLCKPKGESMACQLATYCDLCENDEQCGPNGRCIEDDEEVTFCTYPCQKDDLDACGGGNFCDKIGLGLEDYYCFPTFGQCKGDGTHCTPCQTDDDCLKGHECHENAYTLERYCAKICQTKMDCPKGFGCYEMGGEDYPLCTLEVENEPVETCYQGNKTFCEPCQHDYECESGVCYHLEVANKYFCSFPCDYSEYPVDGCPTSLFCVPNHNPESGGDICAPAPAFGCQGFLNCVAVECQKGEKCVDGFCQPK